MWTILWLWTCSRGTIKKQWKTYPYFNTNSLVCEQFFDCEHVPHTKKIIFAFCILIYSIVIVNISLIVNHYIISQRPTLYMLTITTSCTISYILFTLYILLLWHGRLPVCVINGSAYTYTLAHIYMRTSLVYYYLQLHVYIDLYTFTQTCNTVTVHWWTMNTSQCLQYHVTVLKSCSISRL